MSKRLNTLLQERGDVVANMEAMNDKAELEARDFTTEENTAYDQMNDDIDGLGVKIERQRKIDGIIIESAGSQNTPIVPDPKDNADVEPDTRLAKNETEEYRSAYTSYMAGGLSSLSGEEHRALQVDLDTSGGYITMPQTMIAGLVKDLDRMVHIRNRATIFPVNGADSLGVMKLENDPADPTWTGEISTVGEDSTMSFGKRELRPHPLAKLIKVSRKLVRNSAVGVEALIADRFAYKFKTTMENGYLNGTGANQPLGMFVASDQGISTSRDVATNNTTTAITADGLIDAKYNQEEQYLDNASWMFHRDAVKMIRKLKDSNGQYLWNAGLAADKADTILDLPYDMSEFAPNTFTAGLYVGLIGDMRWYYIADDLNFVMQVLNELYAANNQIGYITRYEGDGMPVLEDAFTRVTLGA